MARMLQLVAGGPDKNPASEVQSPAPRAETTLHASPPPCVCPRCLQGVPLRPGHWSHSWLETASDMQASPLLKLAVALEPEEEPQPAHRGPGHCAAPAVGEPRGPPVSHKQTPNGQGSSAMGSPPEEGVKLS